MFFNDTATAEIYSLSLHDALPIFVHRGRRAEALRQPAELDVRAHARWRWMAASESGCVITSKWLASTSDRKSTRLNSSHANISYAVFCLKKKIIISYILNHIT